MKPTFPVALACLVLGSSCLAQELEKKPDDPYFENFQPKLGQSGTIGIHEDRQSTGRGDDDN